MESGPMELEKIAYVHGDVCLRTKKQRRKRQKLLILEMLYDYAQNSSLHGLRYIVERGLHLIENLFWFLTVVVSVVLCAIFIYKAYTKWITSPVIVAVNGRLTSVIMVPFPSMTICPQHKVKATAYNFSVAFDKYYNWKTNRNTSTFSEEERAKYSHVASMCDMRGPLNKVNNYTLTNSSYVEHITEVGLDKLDIFASCTWYNSPEDCNDLFSRVYTRDGVCYTFNSLAAADIFNKRIQTDYQYLDSATPLSGWSIMSGYNYSESIPYPRRGHVLGSMPDLDIILRHDPSYRDVRCNGLYSGYKIYLQHPADFPQSSLYYYASVPNQVTSLAISFHLFDSDPNLINYSPEIRQCYFPGERKLRYFNTYTMKNCQAECLSNYTYTYCKCVGYYMPHNNSEEICHPNINGCLVKVKEFMAAMELHYELKHKEKACHCLAECNTIEYDAEVLKTEYKLKDKILSSYSVFDAGETYSQVQMYFKKPQFVTMQRRELFGTTDFLANIGGLMGLFLGFSFISLIEIFYFLTLRVGFTLKKDLEEERAKNISTSNSEKDVK